MSKMSNTRPEGIVEQENMSGKADFYPAYIRMVKIHKELQSVKDEYIEKLGNFCVEIGTFSGEIHVDGASKDMSCAIEGVMEGQMCIVAFVGNYYNLPFHTQGQENHLWTLCGKVTILDVLNFINNGSVSEELSETLQEEWNSH